MSFKHCEVSAFKILCPYLRGHIHCGKGNITIVFDLMIVLEENIVPCTVTKSNILMQLLQFYEVNNLQYFIHVLDFYSAFIKRAHSVFPPVSLSTTTVFIRV